MSCVAGHDGEVGACDAESRTSVIGVSVNLLNDVPGCADSVERFLRVEAMLLGLSVGSGSVGEGVVGSVEDGVLAEHGSHCDDAS